VGETLNFRLDVFLSALRIVVNDEEIRSDPYTRRPFLGSTERRRALLSMVTKNWLYACERGISCMRVNVELQVAIREGIIQGLAHIPTPPPGENPLASTERAGGLCSFCPMKSQEKTTVDILYTNLSSWKLLGSRNLCCRLCFGRPEQDSTQTRSLCRAPVISRSHPKISPSQSYFNWIPDRAIVAEV